MRKIILGLGVSLDGFIEGPNGEYDWCFTDQDYGLSQFFDEVDAVFYGRKSYELFINSEGTADQFPKLKTYVFSNTLQTIAPDVTLVQGDIKAAIEGIKIEPGKNIWLFGGAELIAALMDLHLVDEFWLSVHPVILGNGKPLFPKMADRTWLQLIESKTYETGLVSLKYSLKR